MANRKGSASPMTGPPAEVHVSCAASPALGVAARLDQSPCSALHTPITIGTTTSHAPNTRGSASSVLRSPLPKRANVASPNITTPTGTVVVKEAPAKTTTTIRDRAANASRPAAVGGASGTWTAASGVSPRRARATTIQSREMISGGSSTRYTTPNVPTVPSCRTGRGDVGTRRGRPKVEVPGIEPGSFVVLPGLLRAQPALPLLGSGDHAGEFTVTSPVALVSLPVPRPYRKVELPS